MSGLIVRRRSHWRRFSFRLAGAAALLGVTATLATGLQVREIRVTGARRFPAGEVENALRFALGTPTIAAPAETLRNALLAVPWVAQGQVHVSLDGIVTCTVIERTPRAVAVDGDRRMLLDGEGRILGPAGAGAPPLTLIGFGADPQGRACVLGAAEALSGAWGGALVTAERVGPRDVRLSFADSPCSVVADPAAPEAVKVARTVLEAWTSQLGTVPVSMDVRAPGRVAVRPAAAPEAT